MTIVAAWISAETGVGPSIASGSQTWSGNCALLPAAPPKRSRAMPVTTAAGAAGTWAKTSLKSERAELVEDPDQAEPEGQVADAVDDERLLRGAGGGAAGEPEADQQVRGRPTPSQKKKRSRKLSARTSISIEKTKKGR